MVPPEVYDRYHARADECDIMTKEWNKMFDKYCQDYPKEGADLKRRLEGRLPEGWENSLPRYTPKDDPIATRKLSEAVINKVAAEVIPELIGGSADLTGSNNTRWKTATDFQPVSSFFSLACS